jgi:hypothetical protein
MKTIQIIAFAALALCFTSLPTLSRASRVLADSSKEPGTKFPDPYIWYRGISTSEDGNSCIIKLKTNADQVVGKCSPDRGRDITAFNETKNMTVVTKYEAKDTLFECHIYSKIMSLKTGEWHYSRVNKFRFANDGECYYARDQPRS